MKVTHQLHFVWLTRKLAVSSLLFIGQKIYWLCSTNVVVSIFYCLLFYKFIGQLGFLSGSDACSLLSHGKACYFLDLAKCELRAGPFDRNKMLIMFKKQILLVRIFKNFFLTGTICCYMHFNNQLTINCLTVFYRRKNHCHILSLKKGCWEP